MSPLFYIGIGVLTGVAVYAAIAYIMYRRELRKEKQMVEDLWQDFTRNNPSFLNLRAASVTALADIEEGTRITFKNPEDVG